MVPNHQKLAGYATVYAVYTINTSRFLAALSILFCHWYFRGFPETPPYAPAHHCIKCRVRWHLGKLFTYQVQDCAERKGLMIPQMLLKTWYLVLIDYHDFEHNVPVLSRMKDCLSVVQLFTLMFGSVPADCICCKKPTAVTNSSSLFTMCQQVFVYISSKWALASSYIAHLKVPFKTTSNGVGQD